MKEKYLDNKQVGRQPEVNRVIKVRAKFPKKTEKTDSYHK